MMAIGFSIVPRARVRGLRHARGPVDNPYTARLHLSSAKNCPNNWGHLLQPTEVTPDLFEVFMAIKWPPRMRKPVEYFSNVNLFRRVFAALASDPSILKTQVSNDSIMDDDKSTTFVRHIDVYRTVKDGNLLDRWEPDANPLAQR